MRQPASKTKVIVRLVGCDDQTEIPLEVGVKELKFLKKIAAESEKISEFQCMPTLQVEER